MMPILMNAPEHKQLDFSNVGYEEAIERARALIPLLRKYGAANDEATKLVAPVVEALHENGLFRYLQPKAWGGMELDFVAYFDIPEMLGRGDASTAWVVANLASHHRGLAQWPKAAQEEIWGASADTLIASGIAFVQGSAQARRRRSGTLRQMGIFLRRRSLAVGTARLHRKRRRRQAHRLVHVSGPRSAIAPSSTTGKHWACAAPAAAP